MTGRLNFCFEMGLLPSENFVELRILFTTFVLSKFKLFAWFFVRPGVNMNMRSVSKFLEVVFCTPVLKAKLEFSYSVNKAAQCEAKVTFSVRMKLL